MRHWQKPDERPAGTGRELRERALMRGAVHTPGIPGVTSVCADWRRAGRAVGSHRTIAGPRGFAANRAASDEIG